MPNRGVIAMPKSNRLLRVQSHFSLDTMRASNGTRRKQPLNFTAVIYPDAESDWLVAHNPETGTTTQGKTFEEALANLKEATELFLSEFPRLGKTGAILTTFEAAPWPHSLDDRLVPKAK